MNFFKGKRIFITGHTGFKGSLLCRILTGMGAEITGYSLPPPTDPNLFSICGIDDKIDTVIGDIRDREKLLSAFEKAKPEIVIHMAAQPLVRDSYKDPVYTYETNVIGTVNILECLRLYPFVKSFLNVTTDKVYQDNEWKRPYRESDVLNGFDPYSNSKSCSELVTSSYKNSFFSNCTIAISTARSGNVIGGGDFALDRIIPDCIRAASKSEEIIVRNPHSIRPYQHVLEPLFGYLLIIEKQYGDKTFSGSYNVGPDDGDCIATGSLVDKFCTLWGNGQKWRAETQTSCPYEANFLKLDCSKFKTLFKWKPRWDINEAVKRTVAWTKVYLENSSIFEIMDTQIHEYFTKND